MPSKGIRPGTRGDQVRTLLAQYPAGLTEPQMEKLLGLPEGILSSVAKWLAKVYCVGYTTCKGKSSGKPAAIWKLHTGDGPLPRDAVRPIKKHLPKQLKLPSSRPHQPPQPESTNHANT